MISNRLPTVYQQFIHKSRYARWLPEEKRRETWEETVKRYFDYMQDHLGHYHDYELNPKFREELEEAVLNLDIMPSMRAMMTSGPALGRDNIVGYNCSYLPVDSPRAFDECMYILMCGTGQVSLLRKSTLPTCQSLMSTSKRQRQPCMLLIVVLAGPAPCAR